MKKIIYTKSAPEPVGPYSQAILTDNILYCSGQIGIDPKTNKIVEGGVEEETKQILKNIEALLNEAGFDFDDVVKTTCFLDDMNDFAKFNELYAKKFISNPARSCVQAKLPKGAKAEIEIVASK